MAQGLISAGRNRRAGPRRRGLHIPRFAQKGKARSFHRSASPTQTRFAWLCVGGRLRRPLWTNRCPSVPHLLPRLAGTSAEGRRGIPRKRGSGGGPAGAVRRPRDTPGGVLVPLPPWAKGLAPQGETLQGAARRVVAPSGCHGPWRTGRSGTRPYGVPGKIQQNRTTGGTVRR